MPESNAQLETNPPEGMAPLRRNQSVSLRPETVRTRRGILHKYFIEPLSASRNPPWFDARGAAVGLAIGFGCPVGIQTVGLALLRGLFRFNLPVAFAFTWVNNPFTMIQMYYGYYYFGSFCLGKPPSITPEAFSALMHSVLKASYFWLTFQYFVSVGWEFLARWSITATLVAAASAAVGYFSVYRFQKNRCLRRAKQIGISYERLVETLEKKGRTGPGV